MIRLRLSNYGKFPIITYSALAIMMSFDFRPKAGSLNLEMYLWSESNLQGLIRV